MREIWSYYFEKWEREAAEDLRNKSLGDGSGTEPKPPDSESELYKSIPIGKKIIRKFYCRSCGSLFAVYKELPEIGKPRRIRNPSKRLCPKCKRLKEYSRKCLSVIGLQNVIDQKSNDTLRDLESLTPNEFNIKQKEANDKRNKTIHKRTSSRS